MARTTAKYFADDDQEDGPKITCKLRPVRGTLLGVYDQSPEIRHRSRSNSDYVRLSAGVEIRGYAKLRHHIKRVPLQLASSDQSPLVVALSEL